MDTKRYLTVPELERWQHYKDRRPPWMKLHVEILDNYEFTNLPDQKKYQLLAIWLLATQLDNRLPYDSKWIARKINASSDIDLEYFISKNMLLCIDASGMLADCKQSAIAETETETETETDCRARARATERKKWQQPPWINQSAWNEFETHRKEIREPLTDMARTKAANQLKNLTHAQQQSCIDNTIQNRWRGLFPEKLNGHHHAKQKSQSELNTEYADRLFGRHTGSYDDCDIRTTLDWDTENTGADEGPANSLGTYVSKPEHDG